MGFNNGAEANRLRPVVHICAGLGFSCATESDRPTVIACVTALVRYGINVIVRRPPVPAEAIKCGGHVFAVLAEWDRRHGPRRPRWYSRIPVDPGAPHHHVVHVVIRVQVVVCKWPVVCDPVQRLHPKIRRVKPWRMGRPVDRAAADGCEHQRGDVGLAVVDRVVLRIPSFVWIPVPFMAAEDLPVLLRRRVERGVDPAALFKTDHGKSGLCESPCDGSAGRPGADYQDVSDVRP